MNAKISKWKLNVCVVLAALLILSAPIGCWNPDSSADVTRLNSSQISSLTLEKGATIQTVDGIYTSQERETFHSDKRYRELERKYMNILAEKGIKND